MNHLFFIIILFIFGTLFGSFASVLIYRLKSGEGGILTGRSHCSTCHTKLKFYDLVPIFSWISTLGKCRYCKSKISPIYPLLEISMGGVFSLVGKYLVDFQLILNGNIGEYWNLLFFLLISFITILYIFYDILFLEIHEGIMFSGISLAFLGTFIHSIEVFSTQTSLLLGASGIVIIGIFYIIMLKELREIYDIILLFLSGIFVFFLQKYIPNIIQNPVFSGIVGALGIFIFFYIQIFLSRGKALGGGDLRIGIMIGLLLGSSYSVLGIILTYIIGSIIGIFIIIKNWKKTEPNIVPFGPFLGIAFFTTLFFGEAIQNYLEKYFFLL